MEKFYILVSLILATTASAQTNDRTSLNLQAQQSIQAEAQKLREQLLQQPSPYAADTELVVNFQIDTFLIERTLAYKLAQDESTAGTAEALYDAEQDYDKLLNKYYGLLLQHLLPADKKILIQSQRHWIRFRDTERQLRAQLARAEYNGGGSMHTTFVAYAYLDITRKRVFEIFHYYTLIGPID